MQSCFDGLRTVLANTTRASAGPSRVDRQKPPVFDILKTKLNALNVWAADMPQELDAFFQPIKDYFEASGLTNLHSKDEHLQRVTILRSTMGEACRRAMAGVPADQKKTYALFKTAIRKRYLTETDPVHVLNLICQCTQSGHICLARAPRRAIMLTHGKVRALTY
jgi:hypothetical protein